MSTAWASWLVIGLEIYVGLGVLFALAFLWRGVGVIDPQARGGSWGFRVLVFPGCVAFWPLLARRWRQREPPPEERNPHRDRARESP